MASMPTLTLERRHNVRKRSPNYSDVPDYSIIGKYTLHPYNLKYASIVSKGYIHELGIEHNISIPSDIIDLATSFYFVHEDSVFQFAYKISKLLDKMKATTITFRLIKPIAKSISIFKILTDEELGVYCKDLIRLQYIKSLRKTMVLNGNSKERYRFGMATTILFDNCSKFRKTLKQSLMRKFFYSNCYYISTPSSLHGVAIKRSPLRRHGLNIISIINPNQTSTYNPNPNHVLDENGHLILCGSKLDVFRYLSDEGCAETDTESKEIPSNYCQELMKKHVVCVPAPKPVVGSTLAEIPELSKSGINTISLNHQIQHPSKLCNTRIKPQDVLLCCFNKAKNKRKQLHILFQQICVSKIN